MKLSRRTLALIIAAGVVLFVGLMNRFGEPATAARMGRAAVFVIIAGTLYGLLVVWVGQKLAAIREEGERQAEWQRRLIAREQRALNIADQIATLPEHEQQRLQRLAEARGFKDPDDDGWAA